MNSNPSMPPGAMPPGAMPPGAMPPGAMPPGAMPPGAMPPGAPPVPGGPASYNPMQMSSTTTMMGGRRRKGKKRGTRRHSGGQMKMPNMQGGAMPAVGSKAQVWHGSARHTSGGLTKKDLMKHKGRIVSKKKHALGKKAIRRLAKAGYKAKKGTFKLFRK